jgi:hypothetical protein
MNRYQILAGKHGVSNTKPGSERAARNERAINELVQFYRQRAALCTDACRQGSGCNCAAYDEPSPAGKLAYAAVITIAVLAIIGIGVVLS